MVVLQQRGGASGELEAVLAVASRVAAARGIDLLRYQPDSVARGIMARLRTLELDGPTYAQRLGDEPDELARLLAAIAVPTTEFFRDPEVFEALTHTVLPRSVASWTGQRLLRAWVIGSSSGEEAWSLAMLLDGATADLGLEYSVLATDIDPQQVERARTATYPGDRVAQIPQHHRCKHLQVRGSEFSMSEALQRRVVFAAHDVVGNQALPRAAVMASFHLVSLRNVLIYFGSSLQQRALRRVAAVLQPAGVLVLGLVERIPRELEALFEVFPGTPGELGIYRRRAAE